MAPSAGRDNDVVVTAEPSAGPSADGFAALAEGRWDDARSAFEAALARGETAEACFGLAMALWWLGENHACVDRGGRAYALFRAAGEVDRAAQCAVWLAITYKSNFANFAAANGWLGRAERLLEPYDPRPGAREVLAPFTSPDGAIEAPFEVHVVAAHPS
jgi:tetratricopeptide (TPR) repeat protein